MKLIKWVLLTSVLCLPAFGQSNGVYNATTYAYTTQVTQGNLSTGSSSIVANPTAFAQGMPFLPYNINASITINRNAATAETLAPSAIANCFPNSLTCTLSGTFSFKHISGESIQSGTFGLQEALNIAAAAGSGTVLIDASWGGPSGTSLILAAKGASTVMVQDNRNPSGATFYQWNGSAYVATGGSGSGIPSLNGQTGAQSILAGTNISVTPNGTNAITIASTATSGVPSLNSQTGAQTLTAGSNIVITPNGTNQIQIATSGSAGSGSVATGTQYQNGCYPNSGSNTTIGPCPNVWTINPAITGTQLTTFLSTLTQGQDIVMLPPAFGYTPFSNPNNISIMDFTPGAYMEQARQGGIACGANHATLTLSAGNTVTMGPGAAVGETLFIGERTGLGVDAPQYSWLPTITSLAGSVATLSSSVPTGLVGYSQDTWYGFDNTNALNFLIGQSTPAFPFQIPAGCFMLTQTLTMHSGQYMNQQSPITSGFIFPPGQDGFQEIDSAGNSAQNASFTNINVLLDGRIDRTQGGYTAYAANGASTVTQPLYRPLHMGRPDTNNPLGPGWAQNAFNGVASTTQNSAVICYSTASGQRAPIVGNQIVFRDFPTGVYLTTVSSLTGSGCTGSTSPATLAATFPNTSGYTQLQIEWVSTSSVLKSTTALPSTINYPFTINLNQSIAPVPSTVSNVAQHGHVFIAGQQFDYLGVNYITNTMTLRRGPSSCSGADCSSGFAIVPANPCEANYSVPYPVTPTINSGDSTPHGANYFPGECGGNFAFSFPQVNGNTYSGPGLSSGHISTLVCGLAEGTQLGNNTGCIYWAGNTAPYVSTFSSIVVNFMEYGIAGGPASYGMHGVAANGPTGAGNSIRDCTIHAAYPIILSDFQNSKIDRCDTYPTELNPYDGSTIGASTWLSAEIGLDEQTGTVATAVTYLDVNTAFGEPENGNGNENPPGVQMGCSFCNYTSVNFEGVLNYFDGNYQRIKGGQLSNPLILYGQNITIEDVFGLNLGYVTNSWGSNFLNWGYWNKCGAFAGGGTGPTVDCGVGVISNDSGQSAEAAFSGNVTDPHRNLQQMMIKPGEWNTFGQFDSTPMTTNSQVDPTEPFWGWSASCNLGGGAQCQPNHFDGLNGDIFIGPHQRITDVPVFIQADWKTVNASSSFTLVIQAFDNGSGTCSSSGTVASFGISTTTSWTPWISPPFSLAGHAGCIFSPQLFAASTTDTFKVGYFNILPAPAWVMGPASAPTEGAGCPAGTPAGAWMGAFSGFAYFCDGTTIHRVAIS